MCLIVFAWQIKPGVPLIAASNRDEFYARPAVPAHQWKDHPQIYAGRDLEGGGTWLGVAHEAGKKGSRFAALTNVRAPHLMKENAPTRGLLVSDYLASNLTPEEYIREIRRESFHYNGFNLLSSGPAPSSPDCSGSMRRKKPISKCSRIRRKRRTGCCRILGYPMSGKNCSLLSASNRLITEPAPRRWLKCIMMSHLSSMSASSVNRTAT